MFNYFILLIPFIFAITVIMGIVYFLYYLVVIFKAGKVIRAWSDKHNCQLMKIQYKPFRKDPFYWESTRYHNLFYVILKNENNNTCHAYFKFGSIFKSTFEKELDIRWREVYP